MRSRDGNGTFLLSISSIIFLTTLSLSANEYLISYRYLVKDLTLYNEALSISKAMTKCNGTPQGSILLDSHDSKDIKEIISKNSIEFTDYMHKLGLHLEHKDVTINAQYSSTTILTLKTTCFKVDVNENFAKIAPLR